MSSYQKSKLIQTMENSIFNILGPLITKAWLWVHELNEKRDLKNVLDNIFDQTLGSSRSRSSLLFKSINFKLEVYKIRKIAANAIDEFIKNMKKSKQDFLNLEDLDINDKIKPLVFDFKRMHVEIDNFSITGAKSIESVEPVDTVVLDSKKSFGI